MRGIEHTQEFMELLDELQKEQNIDLQRAKQLMIAVGIEPQETLSGCMENVLLALYGKRGTSPKGEIRS